MPAKTNKTTRKRTGTNARLPRRTFVVRGNSAQLSISMPLTLAEEAEKLATSDGRKLSGYLANLVRQDCERKGIALAA